MDFPYMWDSSKWPVQRPVPAVRTNNVATDETHEIHNY
jgi:hypothetical protein